MRYANWFIILSVIFTMVSLPAEAQYFGRNKASYETFDFEVTQSKDFEIYYYMKNKDILQDLATLAETWYHLHQNLLKDTIYTRNPLIFYNDHADFQQTNTISGNVGVGTGGVTEAFKNRVVMPVAFSNQATDQVLGHELVHAFQFNTILTGDSTGLQSLGNLPLWIVEGMAEYMSIGSVDPHTAMWMRDAVLNDDVPSLDDLNNPKYFPYRYGHAFWVFLTGMVGDDKIQPFFKAIALYGVDQACLTVLGIKKDDLSDLWVESLKKQFQPFVEDKEKGIIGKSILDEKDGGRMNISPAISPNGRYVIFLSEKNIFSTDVFLADVNTGKIIKTVASTTRSGNVDNFNFIESSGTWSPDSKQIAYVGFKQGENILIIQDIERNKIIREKKIDQLPAFTSPSWSPDGKSILLTGKVEGQVDLYLFDLETERLTRLTDDKYSELHPSWSPDGSYIVFATDQLAYQRGRTFGRLTYSIAKMDILSQAAEIIDIFPGADNLNPVVDAEDNIIFLSNRDGFRNMYRYMPGAEKVYQLTDLATGISGIAHYSTAISMERRRDRILYTHYDKRGYNIYRARSEDFLNIEVDPNEVTYEAAFLPRVNPQVRSAVDAQIRNKDNLVQTFYATTSDVPYKSKFRLDYIGGGAGVGVGTSNTFGTATGLAGAVDMLFSDILGNNQFYVSLAMNGEISDFGGQVAYLNRKRRINWGASLSHIPFRSTGIGDVRLDTLPQGSEFGVFELWELYVNRIFEDKVGAFAYYPFSTTLRLEFDLDFALYSQSLVRFDNYYDRFGQLVVQDRNRLDAPEGFNLNSVGAALVGDKSTFGLTAPLEGHRFRFGARQYYGEFEYQTVTADYRIYRFFRPVGLAFRMMHYGRYGSDSDAFFPFYLGSPWFVRGFDAQTRDDLLVKGAVREDNFFGSKMLVSNFEIRIPFTGPEQLSLIKSGFLFSDLNFFVDGGLAWYDFEQFNTDANLSGFSDAQPIFSGGVSLRVNLFGALIVEPYYAKSLVGDSPFRFGFNIIPGW